MINAEKQRELHKLLRSFGIGDNLAGFDVLTAAVAAWRPGAQITVLYGDLAREFGSTPCAIERCIRHAIRRACDRAGYNETWGEYFGATLNPKTGSPTNGEFIARLGREYL